MRNSRSAPTAKRKDNALTFEELGVDQIFVDEADVYKNLFYTTKMNRIAGLPNSESNRAFDMYMKTRYVRETSGGRGVVFATGTPISNTMAEMYTMLRYLAPDLLQERGVEHFDAWAANFAEAVTALELAPDGSGYRMHTRFAKFINLPELLSMFRTFCRRADRRHAESAAPEPWQAASRTLLRHRVRAAESLHQDAHRTRRAAAHERVDPSVDNMLKITGEGRKAALDMRLVDAFAATGRRYEADARGAAHHSRLGGDPSYARSTQLVFCDLSTPDPARFNVYDEVRSSLIAKRHAAKRDRLHPRRRDRCSKRCCSMP